METTLNTENVTKETMYEEAKERLKLLGLHKNVLREFVQNHTVYYSERNQMGKAAYGILYWIRNNPRWQNEIQKLEEENGIVVYHAIHSYTAFGEVLDLLYVSKYSEEWEYDRQGLMEKDPEYGHFVMSLCWNLSMEDTEFGEIGIREAGGGLIRTA